MAIPENQLDAGGLTSLANARTPYMNLPLADKSPEGSFLSAQAESLFNRAKIQTELSKQQTDMNIAQLGANTQLQTSSNRIGADIALKQYETQNTNKQNSLDRQNQMGIAQIPQQTEMMKFGNLSADQAAQLGISQQNANTSQQQMLNQDQQKQKELQIQKAHEDLLSRAQLRTEDLQNRGAAAVSLLPYTNDPNFADKVNYMVKNGAMSASEGQQLIAATPDQRHLNITRDLMLTDKADMLSKNPAFLSQLQSMGGTGQNAGTVPVDSSTRTKNNESIGNMVNLISTGQNLLDKNNESFYGGKGLLASTAGAVQQVAQGTLGTGEADVKNQREEFLNQSKEWGTNLLGMMRDAKTSSRNMAVVTPLVPSGSELDKSQADSKIKAMMEVGQEFTKEKQLENQNGIPMNDAAFQQRVSDIKSKYGVDAPSKSPPNYSPADITAIAQHNNVSESEVRTKLGIK